jgi:hypothetical protein
LRERLSQIGDAGQHQPPERVGRYRRESWCTPTIPPVTCRTGGEVTGRETGWARATLSAVYPSDEADRARGFTYLYEDRRVRKERRSGWGIRLWLSYRARRIAGNTLRITLFRFDDGDVDDAFEIGGRYVYQAARTPIQLHPPTPSSPSNHPPELRRLVAELDQILASPKRFRTIVTSRLQALQDKVERSIDDGDVQTCLEGTTVDGGDCETAPVEGEEATRWKERARETLKRHRRFVARHTAVLYTLVTRALPREVWAGRDGSGE